MEDVGYRIAWYLEIVSLLFQHTPRQPAFSFTTLRFCQKINFLILLFKQHSLV